LEIVVSFKNLTLTLVMCHYSVYRVLMMPDLIAAKASLHEFLGNMAGKIADDIAGDIFDDNAGECHKTLLIPVLVLLAFLIFSIVYYFIFRLAL
jgi:hypothetical protein